MDNGVSNVTNSNPVLIPNMYSEIIYNILKKNKKKEKVNIHRDTCSLWTQWGLDSVKELGSWGWQPGWKAGSSPVCPTTLIKGSHDFRQICGDKADARSSHKHESWSSQVRIPRIPAVSKALLLCPSHPLDNFYMVREIVKLCKTNCI